MGTYINVIKLTQEQRDILDIIKKIEGLETDSDFFLQCLCEKAEKHSIGNTLKVIFSPTANLEPGIVPEVLLKLGRADELVLEPNRADEVVLKPGNVYELEPRIVPEVVLKPGKANELYKRLLPEDIL